VDLSFSPLKPCFIEDRRLEDGQADQEVIATTYIIMVTVLIYAWGTSCGYADNGYMALSTLLHYIEVIYYLIRTCIKI
jgi:hypothetical protein